MNFPWHAKKLQRRNAKRHKKLQFSNCSLLQLTKWTDPMVTFFLYAYFIATFVFISFQFVSEWFKTRYFKRNSHTIQNNTLLITIWGRGLKCVARRFMPCFVESDREHWPNESYIHTWYVIQTYREWIVLSGFCSCFDFGARRILPYIIPFYSRFIVQP